MQVTDKSRICFFLTRQIWNSVRKKIHETFQRMYRAYLRPAARNGSLSLTSFKTGTQKSSEEELKVWRNFKFLPRLLTWAFFTLKVLLAGRSLVDILKKVKRCVGGVGFFLFQPQNLYTIPAFKSVYYSFVIMASKSHQLQQNFHRYI